MNIINSQSLLDYNTFKIDVTADSFVEISSQSDVLEVLENKEIKEKDKFILGGGSNILFTKNISGLVIHNQIKGINILKDNECFLEIEVGAGEAWDDFVSWSTKNDFYGAENLSLIPGSVGAAPIQNIGAYGVELKDIFIKLEAVNLSTKEIKIFNKSACEFSYRDSIFKNQLKNEFIITKVYFKLYKNRKINTSYKVLKMEIEKLKLNNPSSQEIRDIIIYIRNSKLPNPKKLGNAGSFFKNPIINKKKLQQLQAKYANMPFFEKKEIKIPAAWLIEQVNWKGYRNATCGVYKNHSLVIVNHQNATGQDIVNLSKKIKQSVCQKFNITLEEEVSII